MRTLLSFLLLLLFLTPSKGEQEQLSPYSEQRTSLAFRDHLTDADKSYILFFTTYGIPETIKGSDGKPVQLRKDAENALQFVLNSNARYDSGTYIEKARPVPGTTTLFYIDIRDFGWSREDVDAVFALQPYFLNPLVDGPAYVFRADWFILACSENTNFDDRGVKDFPHYILTYGKGKEPKDAAEFRKIWQVDEKTLKALQRGSIVDYKNSGVSRHCRLLLWARTAYGQYAETRDVKSHDLDPDKFNERDYIEDFFGNFQDAGEYITNNTRGLQVYLLTAGTKDKFKRVEAGDTAIVVDRRDKEDVRVRTFSSCVGCHAIGHNPATDDFKKYFENGPELYTNDKEFLRAIKSFYFRDKDENIEDANRIYERAIKSCNGLTPLENAKAYLNVIDWYKEKVNLEQAALECGVSKEELKAKLKGALKGRTTGLFHDKGLPRDVWDSLNGGGYIQSILLIRGIKEIEKVIPKKTIKEVKEEQDAPKVDEDTDELTVIRDRAPIRSPDGAIRVLLAKGLKVKILRRQGNNYFVDYDGRYQGFMRVEDLGK